jgi:23S rRNA (adenine1618-N6)-methyltransferase
MGKAQRPTKITGLDIGTGANVVYPIIGKHLYNWNFVASDIDASAVKSAKLIQTSNENLNKSLEIRHQVNNKHIFEGVVQANDNFAFSMCNPPFHASQAAAMKSSVRKLSNLRKNKTKRNPCTETAKKLVDKDNHDKLNFGGNSNELWCEGGELGFIQRMVSESVIFKDQIHWFTTLVSKKETLAPIQKMIKSTKAKEVKVLNMEQGSKTSRCIAWRYR